jgi:putative transposase
VEEAGDEGLPQIFSDRRAQAQKSAEELKAALYQQIGQLTMELNWLKKNLDMPVKVKRGWSES